jgi:hypothetical protein
MWFGSTRIPQDLSYITSCLKCHKHLYWWHVVVNCDSKPPTFHKILTHSTMLKIAWYLYKTFCKSYINLQELVFGFKNQNQLVDFIIKHYHFYYLLKNWMGVLFPIILRVELYIVQVNLFTFITCKRFRIEWSITLKKKVEWFKERVK